MTSQRTQSVTRRSAVAILLLAALTNRASAITVPIVPVGNLGNANDPLTGNLYGGVSYAYSIGTKEVTVGQYTAFLNAVAATDTYSLYNASMATDLNIAGIQQNGASGSHTYSVIGSADKPVTYVSWGDAARFVNWLNNGQPTGAQGLGTTETGAYTLNGATSHDALIAVTRNANATWVIPTNNEWYKAAYHQPAAQGGDTDNYWLYPTRSNDTPASAPAPGVAAPTPSNTANFNRDDGIANGYNGGFAVTGSSIFDESQNYLTDAGAYPSAMGPYGTFDQGGSVWEWTEGLIEVAARISRGAGWPNTAINMQSLGYSVDPPTFESDHLGFRVAAVPEPSSFVLAALSFFGFAVWRRRASR